MKRINLLIACFIMILSSKAQITFHENFENPDSVVSSGSPGWNLYNLAQTSGLFSDSCAAINGSSYLTTIPFSTLGQYHIILEFNQVASNVPGIVNSLEISTNGGLTYTTIGPNEYRGQSKQLAQSSFINSANYSNWYQFSPWWIGGFSQINYNSYWHREKYDISAIASNQSNVIVRFNSTNIYNFFLGVWYIDDIEIKMEPFSFTSTPDCNSNGTATVTPYFGTGPYTYSWNTNPIQSNSTSTGLSCGSYSCTITDAFGVSIVATDTVQPSIRLWNQLFFPSCTFSNGSITSEILTMNNPPYSYLWSNGATDYYIEYLAAGTYSITVSDGAGCTINRLFNLYCTYNSQNILTSNTNADCNLNNGTATVTNFIGGTPPFTYSWSTLPVQTTQTATGLSKYTTYAVTVSDAAGNSAYASIYIQQNNTLSVSATVIPTACGTNTGVLTAQVTGGTSPYNYLWSSMPVQTTQSCTGLGTGTYTVTVTDANTCSKIFQHNVPDSTGIFANINTTATGCAVDTGTATVSFSGGIPPFTFAWSTLPVQTTQTATGLSYGNHSVTVTDAAGCVIIKHGFVNKIIPYTVSFTNTFNNCNCTDITPTVAGGTPPYTYLWNDGTTNQTDSCKKTGQYYLSVTDAAGCSGNFSYNLGLPANCFIDIDGFVFNDLNKNCVKDAGEFAIANVGISLTGNQYNYSATTDNSGHYHFKAVNDVYNLEQYVPMNFGQLCPVPVIVNINVPPGTIVNQDFADTATTIFDDVAIQTCNSFPNMPGANSYSNITIKNKGTTLMNGQLKAVHDAVRNYISSSPFATYNLTNKSITWTYGNLVPGEYRSFSYLTNIPVSTLLGTVLTETDTVFPIATDANPNDNYSECNATVTGSFDPNNKINFPTGTMNPLQSEHQYRINFQNTGNGVALRIEVIDTLDALLDINSLHDVNASHSFLTDTSNGVLHFIFDNIFLPDSNINEPLSHGYVDFKINHVGNIPNGTFIRNKAEIYFDFNPPVITNAVENLISTTGLTDPSAPQKGGLAVVPNPNDGRFEIVLNDEYQTTDVELRIYNTVGQIVFKTPLTSHHSPLTTLLKSGIYFVELNCNENIFRQKMVVKL